MKILIILSFLFLSGCVSVAVKTPDCEANYNNLFKDVDAANVSVCGGRLEIMGSNSNTKLAEAIIPLLKK